MENDGRYLPVHINPEEDLAMLQYTGGTTGIPKGAMLTHHNIYANTVQCQTILSTIKDGEETMLAVLPFFHIFAMTAVMNIGLVKGMKLLIHPRFDLLTVLEDIKKKKPTIMVGVPTMLVAMINYPEVEKYDLKHIRLTVTGGAALPVPVKEAFEEMTGSPVIEGYGLTENSPVATLTPPFGENRPGSIGIPLPRVVLEITDLEDKDRVLPLGETGEICISGPQVMKGYWRPREGMENPVINGRLHTGDIGYIDKDGYVFIVDRLKDMIIAGGYNIYPRNLEDAALEHVSVKEAAVIGVMDDYKGQVPKMYIVLRAGERLTEEALRTHLEKKLAKIYMPEYIIFRDELPKTLIGKVDKKALKAEEA
jgi:long-chain acyl-CoA synthetase